MSPVAWINQGRTKRRAVIFLALLAIAGLATGGIVLRHASRVLDRSAQEVASESEIAFTHTRLDRAAVSPFEMMSAPAVFTHAREFQGKLYLCGPAGLLVYGADGNLETRYDVGRDLPPAPLVALAPGMAAGASEPELFIATAGEGLLAYNGSVFRHLRPSAAPYRRLTAVLPLSSGRLLLGTETRGVLAFDGQRFEPFHASVRDSHVTALAGDEADLWIGTIDQGLVHWRAGQAERPEGLPDPRVLSLAVDGETAWAGTAVGVAEFRGGRLARVLAPGVFARSLLVRGRRLVIGTQDEGVVEIPLDSPPTRPVRPVSRDMAAPVLALLEVSERLYALAEDGLTAVHGAGSRPAARRTGRGTPLSQPLADVRGPDGALLTDRNISALAADGAGKLWVGYFDRGLDIVETGAGARTKAHIEDEHVFCVNRVVHDPGRGMTAVATANGLVLFDPAGRKRQVLGRREGLIADHVTDVLLQNGRMIVATPAGLTFLDAGGIRSLYAFHGLVNNHVYALGISGDRVLAGTLGGLSLLDGDLIRAAYTTANSSLKHNWITAIAPAGGEWFIGTYGAGVLRLDSGGRWHAFPDAREFEVNPNAMLVTESHVLVGTLDRGLYVFDRGAGRWRAVTAGLPSSNVTAVAAAGGFVYVGTDNGLVRIDERNLLPR